MAIITGFEPFGGRTDNASWEVAQHVASLLSSEGIAIEALRLPVEFDAIAPFIARHRSGAVISVGEAASAKRARVETAGRLWQCGTDNSGRTFNRPLHLNLDPPNHTEQTLIAPELSTSSDIRPPDWVAGDEGLADAVRAPQECARLARVAGLDVSDDAGTYICNTTTALGYTHLRRFAFVHVPAQQPTDETLSAVTTFVRLLLSVKNQGDNHEIEN